jgi:hypothetical protein
VENKMINTGIFIWETSRLTGSRTTNIVLNSVCSQFQAAYKANLMRLFQLN